MKVLAINGSPRLKGNTYHALKLACDELTAQGIETEILQIGGKAIHGCIACEQCRNGVCALADDAFNEWCEKLYTADGVILGSPVYYSAIAGTMKCFLDRAFYCSRGRMKHKVGASVAVARRSGAMPTFEQLNNYFLISEMVIAPSYYWNAAHGGKPGELLQDVEAVSVIQTMARNMAWLLQMKEYSRDGVPRPEKVKRGWTNFIR